MGADVAAAWVLQKVGKGRILQGARGAAHVASMRRSLQVDLQPEDVLALNNEIADRGIKGEVFGEERAGGRHTGIMRRNLNGIGRASQVEECLARCQKLQSASPTLRREVEVLKLLGNDVGALEAAI